MRGAPIPSNVAFQRALSSTPMPNTGIYHKGSDMSPPLPRQRASATHSAVERGLRAQERAFAHRERAFAPSGARIRRSLGGTLIGNQRDGKRRERNSQRGCGGCCARVCGHRAEKPLSACAPRGPTLRPCPRARCQNPRRFDYRLVREVARGLRENRFECKRQSFENRGIQASARA